MRVKVKGHLRDLLAFRRLAARRKGRIARAPARPLAEHAVNALAGRLHPGRQALAIRAVAKETATTRSFILGPAPGSGRQELAYFRAGQYLSLKVGVDGVAVTRPYSIASAPYESLGAEGFYQITMKKVAGGLVTPHAWEHWDVGTEIESSGPAGTFYYEPLRDARTLVGLAGGSGITPFRSMAREIVYGELDARLLLLYGSSDEDDVVFYEELKDLQAEAPDQIEVVHVLSCEEVTLEGCEQGFITAEIIRKYADVAHSSFFVCGPEAMYRFVEGELAALGLPRRRIRREVSGRIGDVGQAPGFPAGPAGASFRLTVRIGGARVEVPAQATEPILVAMERAGLAPPSQCRAGECGFCRSRLVAGEVYVWPDGDGRQADGDGRRAADRRWKVIHPCSSYPLSDLVLEVARDV